MTLKKRHKDLAQKLHSYVANNSPSSKYLEWEKLSEDQRDWWYRFSVAILEKDNSGKEIAQ